MRGCRAWFFGPVVTESSAAGTPSASALTRPAASAALRGHAGGRPGPEAAPAALGHGRAHGGAPERGDEAVPPLFVAYVRRSMKAEGDADVSDEAQESVARSRLAALGASPDQILVLRDSGGHHSGFTDQRPGYQELLRLVRARSVRAVAALDQSRLNRNTEQALALIRECWSHGVDLCVGDGTVVADSADSILGYTVVAAMAQHFRDSHAARMRAMFERTFELGGHRGPDPFGYVTARDAVGRILHPRQLVAVEAEAAVVERVFEELASLPFSEISDRFNAERVPRPAPGPWTADAVKAIWDRAWVYLGFVVRGHRHTERRPGQHSPIITEAQFRAALAGVEARKRGRGKPPRSSRRRYLLRGLVQCGVCGTKMRGDARSKSDREYRYYGCPIADGRGRYPGAGDEELRCTGRRARAELAEAAVLAEVTRLVLPPEVLDAAREELARRLALPAPGTSVAQRSRLRTRLENLRKQHEWGDITDAEYQAKREETERQLILLPDHEKLVTFDRHREILVSMADNVERASPDQLRELVELLVERVVVKDCRVAAVEWTPAARPFVDAAAGGSEPGALAR